MRTFTVRCRVFVLAALLLAGVSGCNGTQVQVHGQQEIAVGGVHR